MVLPSLLETAMKAVDLARELVRTRQPGLLTAKGDRDYASEVDFAVERELRAFLATSTPSIGFLGEEEGRSGSNSAVSWALDPVDGTVNFAHAIPLYAVSLALVSSGAPVLGVIDLPLLGNRYTAIEGGGAYRDGTKIGVNRTRTISDAVVSIGDYAVGTNADGKNAPRLAITGSLASKALRVRMFGSAAIDLAWLADGRTDATVMLTNKPWDTAAGVVIAREAGARVVDIDGANHGITSRATIAAGPELIDEVLALIRAATAPAST